MRLGYRLLREPIVHFLALGSLLFACFEWQGGGIAGSRIVLSRGMIQHLSAGFASTWQRPPNEAELKGLVDDYVREEIATREAIAMGLDKDDTILRRRLRQKLEFLVEDAADVPPNEADLQAWLDAHPEAFRIEPRVALRQVYVSRDRRGAAAEAYARSLRKRLQAAGPDARIEEIGDPLMLPSEIELSPLGDVSRLFGPAFADRVAGLEPGRWAGPLESGYGLHLVLVRERVEGGLPLLAQVRPTVERELLRERRRKQLDAVYERLLTKYTVVVERPPVEAGPTKGARTAGVSP
jgi:PPIC-type PPIASE domain